MGMLQPNRMYYINKPRDRIWISRPDLIRVSPSYDRSNSCSYAYVVFAVDSIDANESLPTPSTLDGAKHVWSFRLEP